MRTILEIVFNLTKLTWLKDFYDEKLHFKNLECSLIRLENDEIIFISSTERSNEEVKIRETTNNYLYSLYFQFARSKHQYIYFDSETTVFPNEITEFIPREVIKSSNYLIKDKIDEKLMLLVRYSQTGVFKENDLRRSFRRNAYTLIKTARITLENI